MIYTFTNNDEGLEPAVTGAHRGSKIYFVREKFFKNHKLPGIECEFNILLCPDSQRKLNMVSRRSSHAPSKLYVHTAHTCTLGLVYIVSHRTPSFSLHEVRISLQTSHLNFWKLNVCWRRTVQTIIQEREIYCTHLQVDVAILQDEKESLLKIQLNLLNIVNRYNIISYRRLIIKQGRCLRLSVSEYETMRARVCRKSIGRRRLEMSKYHTTKD